MHLQINSPATTPSCCTTIHKLVEPLFSGQDEAKALAALGLVARNVFLILFEVVCKVIENFEKGNVPNHLNLSILPRNGHVTNSQRTSGCRSRPAFLTSDGLNFSQTSASCVSVR